MKTLDISAEMWYNNKSKNNIKHMEVLTMKNVKYTYRWTEREDYSIPDNNYNPTAESIVCEPPYDFGDYLSA